MESIVVRPELSALRECINQFEDPSKQLMKDPFTRLLTMRNPNTVGQVITSISQQLNPMNTHKISPKPVQLTLFAHFIQPKRSILLI